MALEHLVRADRKTVFTGAGSFNASAATTLTIAAGAITPTGPVHLVDTEGAAATDDLTTITATNFSAGFLLVLAAANAARDVVVKGAGGNINLPNDVDITLDDSEKALILRYDGAAWNYLAGAGIGGARQMLGASVVAAGTYTLFNAATAGKRYRAYIVDNNDPLTRAELIVLGGAAPVVEYISEIVGVLELSNSTTSFLFTNLSGATQSYNIAIEEWF